MGSGLINYTAEERIWNIWTELWIYLILRSVHYKKLWYATLRRSFFKSVLGVLYANHALPFGSRVPTWSLSSLDNTYAKKFHTSRHRWKTFSFTETSWSGRCDLGIQRPLVLWIIPTTLGQCISRMIGRLLTPHRPDFDSRTIDVGFMVDKVEPDRVFLRTLSSFTLSIIPHCLIFYHVTMADSTQFQKLSLNVTRWK